MDKKRKGRKMPFSYLFPRGIKWQRKSAAGFSPHRVGDADKGDILFLEREYPPYTPKRKDEGSPPRPPTLAVCSLNNCTRCATADSRSKSNRIAIPNAAPPRAGKCNRQVPHLFELLVCNGGVKGQSPLRSLGGLRGPFSHVREWPPLFASPVQRREIFTPPVRRPPHRQKTPSTRDRLWRLARQETR